MDGLRAANGRGAGSSRRRDQNGRLSREDSNVKGVAKLQSGGESSGLLEAPFACASGKALRPCGAARCAEGGGAGPELSRRSGAARACGCGELQPFGFAHSRGIATPEPEWRRIAALKNYTSAKNT